MSGSNILVVADRQLDRLADISLELLTAARSLADSTGGEVVALVLGGDASRDGSALAAADRVRVVDDPQLADYAPEPYLAILEHVVRSEDPRAVLFGCTSAGLDLAPSLAARLAAPVVGGCRAVRAEGTALQIEASFCGGKMIAHVEVDAEPAILTLLPGSFRAAEPAGPAQIEAGPSGVALEAGRIEFEQMIPPEAGDVDITQEEVLVAVGRGIEQEDNLELAGELASLLGGQLCASRPIVDQGWLSTTRQVGKSGMIVHPKCYFALGISGAPEHVEGVQNADLFIAVNSDPDAPIFDVAHYGVVGDLLDVVPALTEALKGAAQP